MIITGMSHYESVCKKKLVEWYNRKRSETPIDLSNVLLYGAARLSRRCFILILFCEKYPPGGLTEKKNICYTVHRVN